MHSFLYNRRKVPVDVPFAHQGALLHYERLRGHGSYGEVTAQAAQETKAAPRRITFNAAGKNFIDAYVDLFKAASLPQRQHIVDGILAAAAGLDPAVLDSRNWGQRTRSRRGSLAAQERDEAAQPGGRCRRRAIPPVGARESGRVGGVHTGI